MLRKLLKITIFVFIFLIITACSNESTNIDENKLTIYTTLYPLQYIIEELGSDQIAVETIYPPGVDAHTYEPASKEITKLAKGDAFVYLGANMEGFAETAAATLKSHDILLIELGKHEELFQLENNKNNDGDLDPHIWLDPLRMISIAELVKAELIKLKPTLENQFNERFIEFEKQMVNLNEEFIETLQVKKNKHLLVTHAAYGYWEASYQIEQLAISGLSTTDEPSQKQLANIARTAKELQINYVIFERGQENRTAEIIKDHINGEKLYLHNLEVLTEEDLTNNADYLSIMKDNLSVLDEATN